MKIKNKFYALVFVFLLVGTTFYSSFAIADLTAPAVTPPLAATGVSAQAKATVGISDYRTSTTSSSFGGAGSFSGTGTGAGYYSSQYRASFDTYYGQNVNTYWPILGDRETCEGRQDLLLGVAPFGCQPVVVRSDLIADQNVPVFCQIDAVKINPLIDINQIQNVRFVGQYPIEVAGVGFHPARAALRTKSNLLGSPLINNIGYVVVVLKRQLDESKLPDNINLTLGAQLNYVAGNAYGIGRTEFVLTPIADKDWENEKLKNSFWNGRYFVRLEQVDQNFADVSIYNGDRKIVTIRSEKGKESKEVYLPGMYCRAGLKVYYDGFTSTDNKARIEVSSDQGTDVFDVYSGATFNDVCTLSSIDVNADGKTGRVIGSCAGKRFELSLNNTINLMLVVGNTEGINGNTNNIETLYLGSAYFAKTGEFLKIFYDDKKLNELTGIYVNGTKIVNSSLNVVGEIINNKITISKGSVTDENYNFLNEGIISGDKINVKKQAKASDSNSANAPIAADSEKYYREALRYYKQTADDFPDEPENATLSQGTDGLKYGEKALSNAIELAKKFSRAEDERVLIDKFLGAYPDSQFFGGFSDDLNKLEKIDYSAAVTSIEFVDRARTIRLISLEKPNKEASAELIINSGKENIKLKETKTLIDGGTYLGNITLDSLNAEQVNLNYYCINRRTGNLGERSSVVLKVDENGKSICGLTIKLDKSNVEKTAKIRLLPFAAGTQTLTNFTVNIGIEKRAIKLNPDKALEKIDRLNESIRKWEDISNKLGNVVSGLKTACFGVSAALTFKNFLTGLSGGSLARQQIMNGENGWTRVCQELVSKGNYPTLDACFNDNSGRIEKDVSTMTNAINKVNKQISDIEKQNKNGHSGAGNIFGESINADSARVALAEQARGQYGNTQVNLGNKNVTYNELMSADNAKNDLISTDQIRQAMLYAQLKDDPNFSSEQKKNLEASMKDTARKVNDNIIFDASLKNTKSYTDEGLARPLILTAGDQQNRIANVVAANDNIKSKYGFGELTHTSSVIVGAASKKGPEGATSSEFAAGDYVLGLRQIDAATGTYNVEKVWNKKTMQEVKAGDFVSTYGIGNIKSTDSVSYNNEIASADRVVKYYETEPYKGMPAIVPFELKQGWYAATRQTLPVFGGIGAFDSSGRVTSFWICNVGTNKRIEFESGLGDDICQQINLNTGQPLGYFPGLDSIQARTLINKGVSAIEEAARQYGSKQVTINGQRMQVGKPAVGVPGTKCQDFMPAKDCQLMFNVCDPVICPSSRCDLGGKFPVANVVQTGIAGSALLCLPNIREGIVIPVCLTGIKAGIDSLTSIMKNYKDCLTENVNTGKLVGICDEIYSIYLCDFFWGQVAPFANVLIPKLLEVAYGQGTRGGAEYLTVNAAWQNMENSINYFTQSYAVNSLKSFQARSGEKFGGSNYILQGGVAEVGAEFCKSFVSTKAPNAFKSLIESDSPPQFYAYFDSNKFSDATVPATSQYKVFYHIFAGKDAGVSFSVYLKSPPDSSYYATAPRVSVASGFVARGEYASDTKDFTAPEGYKELCVRIDNDEQCGFKQVSTDFAINYIRDMYANSQLENANIQSEKECISGSSNLGTMLNPNLQAGIKETAFPQDYNRGIVRICATSNPGATTDPTRFVDMGYCSEQKVRCWLDKQSVNNALTANNIGMINSTLEDLNNRSLQALINNKEILSEDDAAASIKDLSGEIGKLEGSSDIVVEFNGIITRVDVVYSKLIFNYQKANLLLLKGRVNEIAAMHFKTLEDEAKQKNMLVSAGSFSTGEGTASSGGISGGSTGESGTNAGGISLSDQSEQDGSIQLVVNENPSNYYLRDNKDIIEIKDNTEKAIGIVIDNGVIFINEDMKSKYRDIDGKTIQRFTKPDITTGAANGGECTISDAYIIDENKNKITDPVRNGTPIGLKIIGNNCNNKQLDFDIYAERTLYPDIWPVDSFIETIKGKKIDELIWSAEYEGNFKDHFYYIIIRDHEKPLSSLVQSKKFKISSEQYKISNTNNDNIDFNDRFVIFYATNSGAYHFDYINDSGSQIYTKLFINRRKITYFDLQINDGYDVGTIINRPLAQINNGEFVTINIIDSVKTKVVDVGGFKLGELDGKKIYNVDGDLKIRD